ncbi:thiol:disulfide interchange protein [Moraxella caviae]|nr:thiol:disulfide interchange protein [Moraxella caviae]
MKFSARFTLAALALGVLSACSNGAANDSTAKPAQTSQQASQTSTPANNNDDVVKALQANLQKSGIDITAKTALPTDMEGIYWATFDGAPAMFTDAKGEHLIQGQIVNISGEHPIDITASIHASVAKEALAAVNPDEMIIFPATTDTKAAIYVFSDPTCHYCQKLHGEIKELNDGGLEVRYLAWPRSDHYIGLTESIWCSSDRKDAITRAKKGEKISAPTCDNPVAKHMALGHELGVSGTPAVFTESGVQIGGYLPAKDMIATAIANR